MTLIHPRDDGGGATLSVQCSSPAIQKVLALASRFARTPHPVLLLGEPGTGKTLLARWIHQESARRGRFVRFPLTNVPEELRHTELFGHARGAFTGAERDRAGAVETAHGGTLLLDELGMASDGLQGALLTVLDDSSVRRLGEERVRPVDVRIVAATNEDLEQRVLEGVFRRDLLGRFGFFRLEIPSLRTRRDDILPLFRLFLARELRDRGEPNAVEVNPEVEEVLRAAAWPDNVRELLNVARYVVAVRDPSEAISVDQLPAQVLRSSTAAGAEWSAQLAATLRRVGGNRSKAASMLGVSRATLYRRQAGQAPESG